MQNLLWCSGEFLPPTHTFMEMIVKTNNARKGLEIMFLQDIVFDNPHKMTGIRRV